MLSRKYQNIWKIVGFLVFLLCLTSVWATAIGSRDAIKPVVANGMLDLANPTVVKVIGQEISVPQEKKFVQIVVTDVFNPLKIPLSFSVHYQDTHGEKSLLGTFSLFPPDNPGKFIVATQGKLQSGGRVIVTLVPLENISEREEIRVLLDCISFIEG